MRQGDLFGETKPPANPRALARRGGPATSHEAAATIAPNLGKLQSVALRLVREHPNHTATELAVLGGFLDPRAINRRLGELEKLDLVLRGPARKCRETARNAAIWTALETQRERNHV